MFASYDRSLLNTNLSTINEAAFFKYSNCCALDCLAMSVGSGNLVGCLCLSVNPSTDIAVAITLDLRMMNSMSGLHVYKGVVGTQ